MFSSTLLDIFSPLKRVEYLVVRFKVNSVLPSNFSLSKLYIVIVIFNVDLCSRGQPLFLKLVFVYFESNNNNKYY